MFHSQFFVSYSEFVRYISKNIYLTSLFSFMFYDFLASDPENLTGSRSDQKARIRPDPDPSGSGSATLGTDISLPLFTSHRRFTMRQHNDEATRGHGTQPLKWEFPTYFCHVNRQRVNLKKIPSTLVSFLPSCR